MKVVTEITGVRYDNLVCQCPNDKCRWDNIGFVVEVELPSGPHDYNYSYVNVTCGHCGADFRVSVYLALNVYEDTGK